MHRREYVQYIGVCSAAGLSGCLTSDTGAEQRLGAVGVFNDTDDALSVSILIVRDGEKLYWRSHELATDDSHHIDPPDYDPGRGQYTVAARVDGGPSAVHEVSETENPVDGNCHFVLVRLTEGNVAFGRGTADEYTNCEESG
ncbi:hypothetical protein SY89_01246 [Halolamina pelagica]|uniref:Uncharacterized protein n=1 Tax=Halolamina pelagica TaxID=699431 RepID=A0A0P7GP42_9EURY|nr:hypothetical protein SY89_01246 [Halolamina pelagica]